MPAWLLGMSHKRLPGGRPCTIDSFGRRVAIELAKSPPVSPLMYAASASIGGSGRWLSTVVRSGDSPGIRSTRLPSCSGFRRSKPVGTGPSSDESKEQDSTVVWNADGDDGDDMPPLAFEGEGGTSKAASGSEESKTDDFDPFGGVVSSARASSPAKSTSTLKSTPGIAPTESEPPGAAAQAPN